VKGLEIVDAQLVLDRGFQRCFEAAEDMAAAFASLRPGNIDLDAQVRKTANRLYEHMLETMFSVLPIVQPEDCPPGRAVNFYFWPGFKSYFTNRRFFYSCDSEPQPFDQIGLGFCADPLDRRAWGAPVTTCSHARWYHYATNRPKNMSYFPGSLYRWFNDQIPRITKDRHSLIQALSVTTAPPEDFTQDSEIAFQVLNLDPAFIPGRSWQWGQILADKVNRMAPEVENRDSVFPDRPDRTRPENAKHEMQYRTARCMLLALWMHASFATEAPKWLDLLEEELRRVNLTGVLEQLESSKTDPLACDWGDASTGRPIFNTWTTISLHWMLTAPPADLLGGGEARGNADGTIRQMIGSATFTSSVPLRRPFIALVRPWIRSIYGMMRNAEIVIHLRQQRAEQLMRAGMWLSHEMNKLLNTRYPNVRRQMDKCDPAFVRDRQAAWDSILEFAELTNLWAKSHTQGDEDSRRRLRARFMNPITELHSSGRLKAALRSVAGEFYHTIKPANVHIRELDSPPEQVDLSIEQRTICFLLSSEMIGNFCRHEKEEQEAEWSVEVSGGRLMIKLIGGTELDSPPPSWTFDYIKEFLCNTGLGEAHVGCASRKLTWLISLKLPDQKEGNA